jgi:hypothetical protein
MTRMLFSEEEIKIEMISKASDKLIITISKLKRTITNMLTTSKTMSAETQRTRSKEMTLKITWKMIMKLDQNSTIMKLKVWMISFNKMNSQWREESK